MLTCGCGSLRCTAPTARAETITPTTNGSTATATYTGTDPAAGEGSISITNAQKGETYSIYRVFGATVSGDNVAYTYSGASLPTGFDTYFTLSNGYVTAKDAAKGTPTAENSNPASEGLITALGTWAESQTALASATMPSTDGVTTLMFDKLPYGYYYITTTSGTAVTVTTAKTVTVTDKNAMPAVDKVISSVSQGSVDTNEGVNKDKRAIAEVGSTVTYTATITTKKNGVKYVYHDKMDSGLSFNKSSVTIKVSGTAVETTNYTLTASTDTGASIGDDTFRISFQDSYVQGLADNTQITISYTATVTSAALQTNPAKNDAHLTYGDNGDTTHSVTKVYNGKITVTKTFTNNGTAVSSGSYPEAGFVLRKGSGTDADPYKYYKETATGGSVTKVEWTETEADATELKTTSTSNELVFQGLADGTYTLIEKTVPAGYGKAADQTFIIHKATDTTAASGASVQPFSQENLVHSASVTNTAGSELPSTGGPGTAWMYAIGGVLVAAAAVGLIARRRMRQH